MNEYRLNIFWSKKDNAFIATCPEFEGLSVVAESRERALKDAEKVLETYIKIYQEDGRPLPESQGITEYSGQIRVRFGTALHGRAAAAAANNGVSLNTYIVEAVATQIGSEDAANFAIRKLEPMVVKLEQGLSLMNVVTTSKIWNDQLLMSAPKVVGTMSTGDPVTFMRHGKIRPQMRGKR